MRFDSGILDHHMSSQTNVPGDDRVAQPLWGNVSFLLMWSSVAASGFGDRVIMLAALTLMGVTGKDVQSVSAQAGINFFFFLPYLLLGAPAGWLADRLPRKWIMLACDESRGALLLLAFLLVPATGVAALPADQHWKVYAIILSIGVFAATFNPARNAMIPQIVPLRQLQSANAMIIGIAVIASLIGLYLGGKVIDPKIAGSVRIGLIIGFLFYAISGMFFAFLKIQPHHRVMTDARSSRKTSRAWSYVRRHGLAWRLMLLNTLMWGVAMVVYNAAIGLCKHRYGFTDESVIFARYTVLAMMIGLGMLMGAGWVAWMNTRQESSGIALAAMFATAISTALLAANRSYEVALGLAFCIGFFGNTTIICVVTLLQAVSPNYLRGRVMGVYTLMTTVSTVAINFIIWRIADADRVIVPVLLGVALLMAVVALWSLWLQMTRGAAPTRISNALWRTVRAFVLVWHRLVWVDRHHMPGTGPVILVANHTTALDPALMQSAIPRIVYWVMRRTDHHWWLGWIWAVIHPIVLDDSGMDLATARLMLAKLDQGRVLGIFPEAGLQRDQRQMKAFKRGLGMLATRSGAPIVPVWIEGTPKKGHMLLHFLWPSRSRITFGKPYHPDPSMSHQQIADDLHERLIRLSKMSGNLDDRASVANLAQSAR